MVSFRKALARIVNKSLGILSIVGNIGNDLSEERSLKGPTS